ncbi:ABC transporter permease [Acetobacterium woodii]|uniref:Putative ABC transport system permease protein n=1 Tax=Acetobacterium woodii (strain ATCC 29683 / DSM 1030 / JCM 2381 / KCTC 1655 / WB1) TaxID=931626 RepID=H6LCU7_ACEWD|nr:ABC transporter permease [Acetobacterium woodii]AFA49084.1 putative ABC transport system permease protein [Acetobacterium woodii DSM 1030]
MILNKRIFRELKENWVRYGALAVLIIFSIGLVVSMAGATDVVNETIDTNNKKNHLEDGAFSVYVPLTENQIVELEKIGAKTEVAFYVDLTGPEKSTLRLFKNRDNINTIALEEGRLAEQIGEIVLEKHYAENHGIQVGQSLVVGQRNYLVTGIGTVPDYSNVVQNVSDVLADLKQFSIGFVAATEFNQLIEKDLNVEYNYSYQLEGALTDTELKEKLVDLDFDKSKVTNKYMKEIINTIEKGKNDLSNGVNDLAEGTQTLASGTSSVKEGTDELTDGATRLADGTNQLSSGLKALTASNATLNKAADDVFQGMIAQVNSELKKMGIAITVTGDNYESTIETLMQSIDGADTNSVAALNTMKTQLDSYKNFKAGLKAYTTGVESAYSGSAELSTGADQLYQGGVSLAKGMDTLSNGAVALNSGMGEFKNQVTNFINENMDYRYVNLITFLEADNNQRITSCKSDAAINKNSALIAGIIVITLMAYMISVFVIHTIDKESAVIGALYSMGYVKKELLRHFMILPLVVVTVAAMMGTSLGFLLIGENIKENVAYYSYPTYTMIFPPYLLVYGIIIPIMITLMVNYLVINNKLSMAPLKLLRREKKQHQLATLDLKEMDFINRYRIRQLMREIRANITLFWGLFIAILLMVFGFSIDGSINTYVHSVATDVEYNYLYLLKYPMEVAPADATKAYAESLAAKLYLTGGTMDVTIMGIDNQNPYFDFSVDGQKNDVVISNSVANKFGYRVGDVITLSDNLKDQNYNFTVKKVVNYASGLYLFMDIQDMRDLFGQEEDYYNTLMSDHELDIETGRIATVITVDKMVDAARQMFTMMYGLVVTILGASILLFVIVMYLLLKMMIDKATFSISLIKVFGYDEKEIKKLYLGTSFYTVVLSTLIAIPISKMIINQVYPYMIANVSAGMKATITPQSYLIMAAIILSAYTVVNFMVGRHLKKISLVEILKVRE